MDALEPFSILPHTALKGLRKLEARFPDRQSDIDGAILAILPNYFQTVNGLGGAYSSEYYSGFQQKAPDYMDWADLFYSMAMKYPDTVAKNLVLGKYGTYIWSDPFRGGKTTAGVQPAL